MSQQQVIVSQKNVYDRNKFSSQKKTKDRLQKQVYLKKKIKIKK